MKYLISIFLIIFLIFPRIVLAQDAVTKLENLLEYIAMTLYVIGVGVLLIIVIVSGIMYMTAGGNEQKVTNAKKTLTYGLIGGAVILCSGFIIDLLEGILDSAGIAY